ncbi:hypothetical protein AN403_6052 [Pseudomonas fluorescens]|uniref:Uncharacterized protein n=1 Tax=Pseudomonas fluorescens TaxID=294 RepID=A0A0P8X784_PSEFL|nr:hypothetical protein AN403_6052 [Pseudomonas fluorescens]
MAGVLCVELLSKMTCRSSFAGVARSICCRKARNSLARWRWVTATTGPAINLLRIEENLSAAWQRLSGTYVDPPLGLIALNATTVPTPSITWTHRTGRPPVMGWTFRLKTMSGYPLVWSSGSGRDQRAVRPENLGGKTKA